MAVVFDNSGTEGQAIGHLDVEWVDKVKEEDKRPRDRWDAVLSPE